MRRPRGADTTAIAPPAAAAPAPSSSPSSSVLAAPQLPPPPRRSTTSSRRSQDSTTGAATSGGPATDPNAARFLPRYQINNFDSGGMPVSLWGMDRRDVWRTCFCFHVRTVTIFIGVWYLMIYILELSFNAALLMYEPGQDGGLGPGGFAGMTVRPETMLPTPVSKIGMEPPKPFEIPNPEKLTIDHSDHHSNRASRVDTMRNGPLTLVLDTSRKATSQVILLTVCNMLITLLMVYGAVRGKPSYLMPFFVLRVFDFCIFCLTMVNYFSYLPNVTEGIMNNPGMPFRNEFLRMDRQILSFITLIFIVAFIAVKAYIIGVIWNCYKYLMLRNTVIRGVIAYRHDGDPSSIMGLQQNLLPDLPDYETAVNDPRYAKKPPSEGTSGTATGGVIVGGHNHHNHHHHHHPVTTASSIGGGIMMPPPPPYSVAVASEPLYFMQQQQQQQHLQSTAANNTSVPQSTPSPTVLNNNNNNVSKVNDDVDEQVQIQVVAPAPIAVVETSSPIFLPVQSQQQRQAEEETQTAATATSSTEAKKNEEEQ